LLLALRGDLRFRNGDAKGAEADFEKSLSLDPKQAFALAGEGMVLRSRGDLAGAIKRFDEAAKLDPSRADYPYFAAQAELARGRTEEARADLEKALQIDPGYAPACNDLAWLLAQDSGNQKSLDRALDLAERAQRLRGGPEVLDTLGYVELQRGDVEKAVATLQKAVAAKPDYATARYHLGLALLRQGNREAARSEFTSALAGGAFPEEKDARVELARLQKGGEETSR
jgi:tetratricopeptide (TPR) repeat protein